MAANKKPVWVAAFAAMTKFNGDLPMAGTAWT
jgi:hypothetical protein